MGLRPTQRRRLTLALLAAWLLSGAVAGWAAYRFAARPVNPYASSVALVPKTGGYGSVRLSFTTLSPAQAVVMLGGGDDDDPLFVSLPERRMFVAGPGEASPSDVPFTVEELSSRLRPGVHPDARRELWEMVTGAADAGGFTTRPTHFVLADANPWVTAWSGRAGRLRVMLAACGVVVWIAGVIELGRRLRARHDQVEPA